MNRQRSLGTADSGNLVSNLVQTVSKPEQADGSGSLLKVIHTIPSAAYQNPTWKGLAYFTRDLIVYGLCVAGLIVWSSPLIVVPLWIVTSLAISALFVVGHDAAHQALFKSRRLNDFIGRVAMLPAGHLYSAWVYGHNRVHHGFTVRQGFDFVWHPHTPRQFHEMNTVKRLRHRFEWSWLGAGAYYLREVWWNKMIRWTPPARFKGDVRKDRAWLASFLAIATIVLTLTTDPWTTVRVLVIPLLGFMYIIGSIVHVHHIAQDIRWLPRDKWTRFAAQMEGTTILRVPRGMNFFLHWIMVHVPHHVDMRIPMYNLELAANAIERAFPGTVVDKPLSFREFIHNSRACKLFDFEAGHWLDYRQAEAMIARPT